jgi:hypothetical protein
VEQWGQKGTLELAKILDCAKGPVDLSAAADGVPDEVEEMAKLESAGPALSRQASATDKLVQTTVTGADGEEYDFGDDDGSILSEPPDQDDEDGPISKKPRTSALEEYDAKLDAADQEGGFMEGVGIHGASRQNR